MVKIRLLLILLITLCLNCVSPSKNINPDYAYDSITFEICAIGSASLPSPYSLKFLVTKLSNHQVCRAENITFVLNNSEDSASEFPIWNTAALSLARARNRKIQDLNSEDKNICIFILFVKNKFVTPTLSNLAGLQFGTTIAIFEEQLERSLEGAVLLHEFGHVMKLGSDRSEAPVNPDRPSHCNNPDCVMFWMVSDPKADFDSECIKEIKAMI